MAIRYELLQGNLKGLYIHVPFCVKKCAYCDFYSLPGYTNHVNPYIDSLFTEALRYRGMRFDTLYIGGGTPSLLGAGGVTKLFNGIRDIFDLKGIVEGTIEVNPDSGTPEFLRAAREVGLGRVSIGVQSLTDAELRSVGRVHNAAQAIAAIRNARITGFNEISADIIIGLPGQSRESLRETIEELVTNGITHLSAYCLSLEAGTPLADNPPSNLPSEDEQAELFEDAIVLLAACGFEHYEISNFARPGHESRHNLNYWRGGEYLGLGPSAASHLAGRRFKNRSDFCAYIGNPDGEIAEEEKLSPVAKANEEAILRLRLLSEGLDIRSLAIKFGERNTKALEARLKKLSADRLLINVGSNFRIPRPYALTCNPILTRVIDEQV